MSTPDLTTFRALSFDCYGTIIDWETGLTTDLSPILTLLPATHPWNLNPRLAVFAFNTHSASLWSTQPTLSYPSNLSTAFRLLAAEAAVPLTGSALDAAAEAIGTGPGRWPAFTDSLPALRALAKRYPPGLAILSNVDEANIARTLSGLLGPDGRGLFKGVYTAETIGSYKPDVRNFEYLFARAREDLDGTEAVGTPRGRGQLLHVGVGLREDMVPAKRLGLRSVYIARRGEPELERELVEGGEVGFEWRFETLGEFAAEVERQFVEKEKREGKE